MKYFPLVSAMVFMAGSAMAQEHVTENSLTASVSPGDPVTVSNISGDIFVLGGDGDAVEVSWKLTCDTREEMDAVTVICEAEYGVHCRVEYDDSWNDDHSARVDFLLSVPGDIPLDYRLENVNGTVELKDASGNGEISLVNGDVLASGFTGPLSIEVVNGELTVDDCPGLERAELVNGSLFVTLEEMAEDLSLRSVNGTVRLKLNTEARVELETLSGSMEIPEGFGAVFTDQMVGSSAEFGTGSPVVSVSTVSGDIEIL